MYVRELFIRKDRCNGCGICARDYPTLFKMDATSKAEVQSTVNLRDPKQESDASYAIEKCGTAQCGGAAAIWGRGEGEQPGQRT
jgi:ferredoxin